MDWIHIQDLRLWAHVGVLDHEGRDGQWFRLDIKLGLDLSEAAKADNLRATADYSQAVRALQQMVRGLRCSTIERFSEEVFEELDRLYGPLPIHLILQKCNPPIPGFTGAVAIERWRHWPPQSSS